MFIPSLPYPLGQKKRAFGSNYIYSPPVATEKWRALSWRLFSGNSQARQAHQVFELVTTWSPHTSWVKSQSRGCKKTHIEALAEREREREYRIVCFFTASSDKQPVGPEDHLCFFLFVLTSHDCMPHASGSDVPYTCLVGLRRALKDFERLPFTLPCRALSLRYERPSGVSSACSESMRSSERRLRSSEGQKSNTKG